MKVIGVTGHRIEKLIPSGLDPVSESSIQFYSSRLQDLAFALIEEHRPEVLVCGMEPTGFDMKMAIAALNSEPRVHLIGAIPYASHASRYPQLMDLDESIFSPKIISPGGYAGYKMQRRNQYIVDNCDLLLALSSGKNGGTLNCLKYAEGKGRRVINYWDCWERRRGTQA